MSFLTPFQMPNPAHTTRYEHIAICFLIDERSELVRRDGRVWLGNPFLSNFDIPVYLTILHIICCQMYSVYEQAGRQQAVLPVVRSCGKKWGLQHPCCMYLVLTG